MSHKTINIPIDNDWGCPDEIELTVNNQQDISTAGVINQVVVLNKMAQFRIEVKTIMSDIESDPKLKKAFQSVFEDKQKFAKLSQWVEEKQSKQ